jgi:hypothetical protein
MANMNMKRKRKRATLDMSVGREPVSTFPSVHHHNPASPKPKIPNFKPNIASTMTNDPAACEYRDVDDTWHCLLESEENARKPRKGLELGQRPQNPVCIATCASAHS